MKQNRIIIPYLFSPLDYKSFSDLSSTVLDYSAFGIYLSSICFIFV